jgi:hypothetical protein
VIAPLVSVFTLEPNQSDFLLIPLDGPWVSAERFW